MLGFALVSTHSRPKAAGKVKLENEQCPKGFNTQPPEGGWPKHHAQNLPRHSFNTQPPEGGWTLGWRELGGGGMFQHTAARRRLGLKT